MSPKDEWQYMYTMTDIYPVCVIIKKKNSLANYSDHDTEFLHSKNPDQ